MTVVVDECAVPCTHSKDASASADTDSWMIDTPQDMGSDLSTDLGSEDSEPEQTSSGEVSEDSPMSCSNNPFSVEETLMIFDWDDTLLPSTWVMKQGLSLVEESVVTEAQAAELSRVAEAARTTLLAARRHGSVIIVTNGEQGWVELSCWKFMPTLAPALEGVPIISARSTYEKQGITSPFEWKVCAFSKEVEEHYKGSGPTGRRNVISLGDSMHEHLALMSVTQGVPRCRAKSLKFASFPELSQLVEQHELVSGRMGDIADHDGDLVLEVHSSP